jgi:hypothetical protein
MLAAGYLRKRGKKVADLTYICSYCLGRKRLVVCKYNSYLVLGRIRAALAQRQVCGLWLRYISGLRASDDRQRIYQQHVSRIRRGSNRRMERPVQSYAIIS